MANAEALPDYCYQKTLLPCNRMNLDFSENENEAGKSESEIERSAIREEELGDQLLEYETDSNSSSSDAEEDDGTIDPSTFFMVGRTSRDGRAINMKIFK